jgi:hypothetical protein
MLAPGGHYCGTIAQVDSAGQHLDTARGVRHGRDGGLMTKKKKKPTKKSKGTKVNIQLQGVGNVVGHGNKVSVVGPTNVVMGAPVAEFTALLAQLREGLMAAKLDEKARKAVENDIEAIQAEAKHANPSLPVVEGKLKSVESIVTRTVGIGTTLAPIVQKFMELGQHLFK